MTIYYEELPMTTCGNSKADDTIGVHDVTGLYTNDSIYDKDFRRTAHHDATVKGMGREEKVTIYDENLQMTRRIPT